jgi:hypothetical protein
MSNQAMNLVLISNPNATVTNSSWERVQELAQVGDIIKQHGRTFEVARKEFVQQMDNSFEIKLFEANNNS